MRTVRTLGLGEEANVFDRFIGTWDCDYANFKDDGKTERSHGQVVFGWILDGRAVQDVWSWVDDDDPKKERKVGTTVRFFDSKTGKWRIVWISPEEGIIKTLAGGREGDRIVLEGTSDDGVAVRWSFNDIRPDSFVWRGEKSRDYGKSWKPTGEYQMRRSSAVISSSDSIVRRARLRRVKKVGVRRRLEIVRAEGRDRKLARCVSFRNSALPRPVSFWPSIFALQFHEGVEQRLRPRRAAGDVNVDRDVAIDSFQNIVALLERSAGNGAGAHRDDVFRVGHLVVEPDDLRRHFFGHGAGHDHEIGLARRGAENFAAEAREIVARGGGRDHLDRATGEPELERPDRILPAPIIKLLHRGHPDALLLQLALQPFVDLRCPSSCPI